MENGSRAAALDSLSCQGEEIYEFAGRGNIPQWMRDIQLRRCIDQAGRTIHADRQRTTPGYYPYAVDHVWLRVQIEHDIGRPSTYANNAARMMDKRWFDNAWQLTPEGTRIAKLIESNTLLSDAGLRAMDKQLTAMYRSEEPIQFDDAFRALLANLTKQSQAELARFVQAAQANDSLLRRAQSSNEFNHDEIRLIQEQVRERAKFCTGAAINPFLEAHSSENQTASQL